MTGTKLTPTLRNYLLTLDNNTIYLALANQGHRKTENAYWKGVTAMRAEPDHRWSSTWDQMWKRVPLEVDKLPKAPPSIPAEALEDPDVQRALRKFAQKTNESRILQQIREEVDRKIAYLRSFSAADEVELRKMVYVCLYAHCPFQLPPEGKERMTRIIAEGHGEAFLGLAQRFNDWQPLPLEFQ
jgi:hypothetical protein